MSNEILFLIHLFCNLFFLLGALRYGKEALKGLVCLQAILANLFVTKQIALFGLNLTCSDVYAIGAMLGINLLQEYWGQKEAKGAIRISFFALVVFLVASQIHLFYEPASVDRTQSAFLLILGNTPRILLASMGVYFLVQQIDLRFFGFLKKRCEGKFFPLRALVSLVLMQGLDTVLFSFFGLYGILDSIGDVILFSLIIKSAVIGFNSSFLWLTRKVVPVVSL